MTALVFLRVWIYIHRSFSRAKAEKGIAWHIDAGSLDSYQQEQINQSDCEICSNCGKINSSKITDIADKHTCV